MPVVVSALHQLTYLWDLPDRVSLFHKRARMQASKQTEGTGPTTSVEVVARLMVCIESSVRKAATLYEPFREKLYRRHTD